MHAYRPSKKLLMLQGLSKEKVDFIYEKIRVAGNLKHYQRSKQIAIMKLPAFSTCMIVHLDAVNQILNREKWWDSVDLYFELLPKYIPDGWNICVDKKVIKKLKNDIESYVPRISQKERQIIAKAESMFGDD